MTEHSSRWFDTVRVITEALVSIASVSPDVEAENRCAEKIHELLAVDSLSPTFWDTDDGRKNVACLLKSDNPNNTGRTIVLMSHFDTVGIEDFARFGDSNIAFQPEELAKVMRAAVERKDSLTASEKSTLIALQSGEWMFGRGSVDMKSGVAINIALMREFSRKQGNGKRWIDELAGNLLFLSCPDEEAESAGILAAVPELLKLREQEALNYLGVINTDYTAPRDTDENQRYIYSGTVGKLLPSFYILGARTHVGEIYRGVDASHIAAELVSRINLNPEWIDTWQGSLGGEVITEVAPPPVALHMRDLKPSYNVETAGEAFVYFNWLTLKMTVGQAMHKMKEIARASLEAVSKRQEESFKSFSSQGGQAQVPPEWISSALDNVLGYDRLYEIAARQWKMQTRKISFNDMLKEKTEKFFSEAQDGRQLSRMIVAELTKVAQISGPAVILFFSPPYYPSARPQENELTLAVKSALGRSNEKIQFRGFYPYISDLSYVRLDEGFEAGFLKNNMPLFGLDDGNGKLYYPLVERTLVDIRALNCPVVNIGPFGNDAHGLYERVHMPYSFVTVPQIISETIISTLKEATT
ncbi:MAG TPA: M20/M25/M40 family metallo-hydrolase [Anaerolineales bacterium]|nr:M20/M25/M40 family metallo-hydrolase [Anaerolineales bacterium]